MHRRNGGIGGRCYGIRFDIVYDRLWRAGIVNLYAFEGGNRYIAAATRL